MKRITAIALSMVLGMSMPTMAADDAVEPVPDPALEAAPWAVPASQPALIVGQEELGPDYTESIRSHVLVGLDGTQAAVDSPQLWGFTVCPGGDWVTSWVDDVVPGEPNLYAQPTAGGERILVMEGFGWHTCLAGVDGPLVAWMPRSGHGAPLSITDLASGGIELLSERAFVEIGCCQRLWDHAPSGQLVWVEDLVFAEEPDATGWSAVLFDARSGERRTFFGPGEDREVSRVAWSRDGRLLAYTANPPQTGIVKATTVDGYIHDLATGDERHVMTIEAIPSWPGSMALSDSGALAWANDWTDMDLVALFDAEEAQEAAGIEQGEDTPRDMWTRLIVVSPDGDLTEIPERVRRALRPLVAWAPDGDLVYLNEAGELVRWSQGDGRIATGHVLEGPDFEIGEQSPGGRYLALTNGWSDGPDDPLEVLVFDMVSDELDSVYLFDEPNASGWVSWWPE